MRERAPDVFGATTPLPVPAGAPQPPSRTQRPAEGATTAESDGPAPYDPLRLCIYTTIGLIAWLITPPLTVGVFGTIGVVGYARARRRGLASSRCLLGDTRLVIGYLAVAAIAGYTATFVTLF